MLKLKTKTEFTVPTERGTTSSIVRLIIDKLEIDINNITAKGYYYYFDADGVFHQLDKIDKMYLWSDVAMVESGLPTMPSNSNLFTDLSQRLKEFTFFNLGLEAGTNYNTAASDWEVDTE